MPTDLTLDFSAPISGSLLDKDGEGTGFSSVQANSTGNPYDFGRIDLNISTSSLILTATQGSNTNDNTLKNALETGIDAVTQPFTISSRLQGPFTNLTTAAQQGGIFLGSNQDNYVKLVIINNGTNGLGLQFFEEQNGVSASVGGGSEPQIGLQGTDINTLDLFLNGDPLTGIITAAYRINSDTATPTPFNQEFTPSSLAIFFTDAATARAGILAFTKDAADTTVTFDSFSVKPTESKPFSWITATPSPIQRSEAGSVVTNHKLYVFGGYVNSSFQATTRSDVYDPATNTWTQLADMPQPITHAGIVADGNTIYLAGGYIGGVPSPSTAKVFKYNVTANTWSQGPSLPAPRGAGGLVRLGRELHFVGGLNANRTVDKGDHWVFNLDNGTQWLNKAPLPNPRNHFGYKVNNDKIYVIGGQHLLDERRTNQSDVHSYDPLTNTWAQVASLPYGRSHTHNSTLVKNGQIIIVGGRANGLPNPRTLADVTAYDPMLNTWVALSPLPEPRQATVAKIIDGRIIVTTGSASGPNPQTTTWIGV
jgi:N-acetylneuraminic acid mutarotase